jgi:hypothetical protein
MHEQVKGIDVVLGEISLSGYPEITAWCTVLRCSEVQLAEAIAAVGYSAAKVQSYLSVRSGMTGMPSG